MAVNVSFLQDILASIAEQGRHPRAIERRRHDDQPQVRAHRLLQRPHDRERDVAEALALAPGELARPRNPLQRLRGARLARAGREVERREHAWRHDRTSQAGQ